MHIILGKALKYLNIFIGKYNNIFTYIYIYKVCYSKMDWYDILLYKHIRNTVIPEIQQRNSMVQMQQFFEL